MDMEYHDLCILANAMVGHEISQEPSYGTDLTSGGRTPTERREGICPFLSLHFSLLDLSRHHYRFILSEFAEGDIAKKLLSESDFSNTFRDIFNAFQRDEH